MVLSAAWWGCAEEWVGAVPSTKRVWNRTWLTPTETSSRGHANRTRASRTQTTRASSSGTRRPGGAGMAPPARRWNHRATAVETPAASPPRTSVRRWAGAQGLRTSPMTPC